MTRETAFGWTGSIVFHIAAAFIFFLVRPSQPDSQQQEFVEFSFGGGIASSFGPMPKGDVLPEGTPPPPIGQAGVVATGVGVDLPTHQNTLPSDEIVNSRPTKKLEANDNPIATARRKKRDGRCSAGSAVVFIARVSRRREKCCGKARNSNRLRSCVAVQCRRSRELHRR